MLNAVVFFMFSWRRCFRQLKLCSQLADVGVTDITLFVRFQSCGKLPFSTIWKTSLRVMAWVSSSPSVVWVECTVLRLMISSLTKISRSMRGTSGYFPLIKRGLISLFFNRSSGKRNSPTISNKTRWLWIFAGTAYSPFALSDQHSDEPLWCQSKGLDKQSGCPS